MTNFFIFIKDFILFLTFSLTLFTNRSITVSSSLCFNWRPPANSSIASSTSFLHPGYFKDCSSLKLGFLMKSLISFWLLIRRGSPMMMWSWSGSEISKFSQLQGYISSLIDCSSSSSIDCNVYLKLKNLFLIVAVNLYVVTVMFSWS